MRRLLLFNPENDIMLQRPAAQSAAGALALGAAVEALRRCGALLPAWWAAPGDAVLVPEGDRPAARRWLDGMAALFPALGQVGIAGVDGVAAAEGGMDGVEGLMGAPWGWSGDAARRLGRWGARCPDVAQLERMRQLSHRRTSLEVMRRLHSCVGEPLPPLPPLPVEAATVAEVRRAAAGFGAFFLKAPWSSSGRGVARYASLTPEAEARAASILRRQGSVMVERALDGVQDFAMLFWADGGRVGWRGYSLFFTERSSYGGNLVLADAAIEERLVAMGADRTALSALRGALERSLTAVIGGDYSGWLGVDMLLASDGMIAPCLEVNLRMTMGVVARHLARHVVAPGREAVYRVAPVRGAATPAAAPAAPPTVADGRLVGGTLPLVPPGGAFAFALAVR